MIDTNSSGTITFDELKDGLGSELMESEIQDLMDVVSISCGRIILISFSSLLIRSYIIFGM